MYRSGSFFNKPKKRSKSNGQDRRKDVVRSGNNSKSNMEALRMGNNNKTKSNGRKRKKSAEEEEEDSGDDAGGLGEEEDFLEEHTILRVPIFLADRIRELIKTKEGAQSIGLTFSQPREGAIKIKNKGYPVKLVDLPTLIESQKIFNNKQMVKIADISQMIVVDDPTLKPSRPNKKDPYIWSDGITPPLKNVRKRRFRKRVSRQTIEIVENELERLLTEDVKADDVIYELADASDGNDSDNSGKELNVEDNISRAGTEALTPGAEEETNTEIDYDNEGGYLDLEKVDESSSVIKIENGFNKDKAKVSDDDEDDEDEDERESDNNDESGSGDDDDETESGDSDETESESDDDEETAKEKSTLKEAKKDTIAMIAKRTAEYKTATNPIIRARFEAILVKLNSDLDEIQTRLDDISRKND
ncbi:hypothetical protein K502DRAFT_340452 [Neoconidiobolus thromboides FSU 785]|nr:hypothetical protein K502DRAFT_340452 [Neoconidiobolus thromboides FSU 785]